MTGKIRTEEHKKNNKDAITKLIAKSYLLRSPDGIIYEGRNIKAFAKKHNLSDSALSGVIKGSRLHHKKWTLITTILPTFNFCSPEGMIYKDIFDVKAFAKKHNLHQSHLNDVKNGRKKHHKGWTICHLP